MIRSGRCKNHTQFICFAMVDKNDSLIIWYIPGFRSADDPQIKAYQLIRKIYPNAEDIINVSWENQNGKNLLLQTVEMLDGDLPNIPVNIALSIAERWKRALSDVERWADLLANKIANDLSPSQREKLILIGHSLGGNMVIRTLAHLHRQKLSIKSAVLLGAAIDNQNENILLAMNATQKPIYSMINPGDAALNVFKMVEGSPALGTGCKLRYNHSKFREYLTSASFVHSSAFYLSEWAELNNVKRDDSVEQLLNDYREILLDKLFRVSKIVDKLIDKK